MARRERQLRSSVVVGPPPESLLDVTRAAAWLGVGRTTLFTYMKEPDFPVIRLSPRKVRFDPQSLYQWALKRQLGGSFVA